MICATNRRTIGAGDFVLQEHGGFRTHHKYMIAAIGVIAVLAFLYNLGIFDVWTVEQAAK